MKYFIQSYGGAELKASVNKQIPFYLISNKNTKEKAFVASKAAALVKPGDIVFFDGSTSTYFMTEHIADKKNITVITNSLASMTALSELNVNVYLAGGRVNSKNRSCFTGKIIFRHTNFVIYQI